MFCFTVNFSEWPLTCSLTPRTEQLLIKILLDNFCYAQNFVECDPWDPIRSVWPLIYCYRACSTHTIQTPPFPQHQGWSIPTNQKSNYTSHKTLGCFINPAATTKNRNNISSRKTITMHSCWKQTTSHDPRHGLITQPFTYRQWRTRYLLLLWRVHNAKALMHDCFAHFYHGAGTIATCLGQYVMHQHKWEELASGHYTSNKEF